MVMLWGLSEFHWNYVWVVCERIRKSRGACAPRVNYVKKKKKNMPADETARLVSGQMLFTKRGSHSLRAGLINLTRMIFLRFHIFLWMLFKGAGQFDGSKNCEYFGGLVKKESICSIDMSLVYFNTSRTLKKKERELLFNFLTASFFFLHCLSVCTIPAK